jgi:hypothetical protein
LQEAKALVTATEIASWASLVARELTLMLHEGGAWRRVREAEAPESASASRRRKEIFMAQMGELCRTSLGHADGRACKEDRKREGRVQPRGGGCSRESSVPVARRRI